LRLVKRYVLTFTSSVFLPMITPSFTDQYFSCPSQPLRSLPLNSSIFSGFASFDSFLSSLIAAEQSRAARQGTKATIGFHERVICDLQKGMGVAAAGARRVGGSTLASSKDATCLRGRSQLAPGLMVEE